MNKSNNLETRYVKLLHDARVVHDTEEGHMAADDLLCNLLQELGYFDVVIEYHKQPKWYA